MALNVKATVIGAEKVQASLLALPAGVRPLYERAALYGQQRMKEHAKPQHSGPAKFATGVEVKLEGMPPAMKAHIGYLRRDYRSGIASTVNYGRRPGKMPPEQGITRWLRLMGYQGRIWPIRVKIAREGTKGKYFLERTEEDLNAALPRITREVEGSIAARWGRA